MVDGKYDTRYQLLRRPKSRASHRIAQRSVASVHSVHSLLWEVNLVYWLEAFTIGNVPSSNTHGFGFSGMHLFGDMGAQFGGRGHNLGTMVFVHGKEKFLFFLLLVWMLDT